MEEGRLKDKVKRIKVQSSRFKVAPL